LSGAGVGSPATAVVTIFDDDSLASASQRFVNQAYLDLLGRPADGGGLAYWSGQIDRGLPHGQLAAALVSSQESQTLQGQNLCLQLLGRPADANGLAVFVQALQQGATLDGVRASLVNSVEYFQGHGGGTVAGFVQALYRDVLGRDPDSGGQAFFRQALPNGAARFAVAAAVLSSGEARQRLVQGAYQQLLRRPVDAAGLDFWAGALGRGFREESLAAVLVGSDEYFGRL